MPKPFVLHIGDSDHPVYIPTRNEVCDRCGGDGHHANPSFDGLTVSEISEAHGPDASEWLDGYLSGIFDVHCATCNGRGLVRVVDEEKCPPEHLELYRQEQAAIAEDEACARAERRMGA